MVLRGRPLPLFLRSLLIVSSIKLASQVVDVSNPMQAPNTGTILFRFLPGELHVLQLGGVRHEFLALVALQNRAVHAPMIYGWFSGSSVYPR